MVDGNLFPYTGADHVRRPVVQPDDRARSCCARPSTIPAGVLRPNQYVRVRLTGAIRPNAVVVPQRAVQQSAKGHFVWVVNKDRPGRAAAGDRRRMEGRRLAHLPKA